MILVSTNEIKKKLVLLDVARLPREENGKQVTMALPNNAMECLQEEEPDSSLDGATMPEQPYEGFDNSFLSMTPSFTITIEKSF